MLQTKLLYLSSIFSVYAVYSILGAWTDEIINNCWSCLMRWQRISKGLSYPVICHGGHFNIDVRWPACGPHCNGILVCTLLISCINMAQIHDTALIADIIIMYKHEMVKLWLILHSGWQRQVDPQWSSSNWCLTHKKLEMLVCIQHCSYWCPGAKSPGHQYSQWRLNIHCFVMVSYQNITII